MQWSSEYKDVARGDNIADIRVGEGSALETSVMSLGKTTEGSGRSKSGEPPSRPILASSGGTRNGR